MAHPLASKNRADILVAVLLLIIFAIFTQTLLANDLAAFDGFISRRLMSFASPALYKLMLLITTLGSYNLTLAMAFFCGFILFRINPASPYKWAPLIAQTGAALFNFLLKDIFHRTRPDIVPLIYASGYSFPSGHSMIAMAFYGMIAYLLWKSHVSSGAKYLSAFLLGILIMLVGISRIYLGVHYPSDVLAGFAAGGVWLLISIHSLNIIDRLLTRLFSIIWPGLK